MAWLRRTPPEVVSASLLVDYTLTVAVSISSGVLAIGSAFNFNDNATARTAIARMARGQGASVVEASTAAEALAFDVALQDLGLVVAQLGA